MKSKINNQNIYGKRVKPGHFLLIITLNVIGLNSPVKRCRVAEQIKKENPFYLFPTRNTPHQQRYSN